MVACWPAWNQWSLPSSLKTNVLLEQMPPYNVIRGGPSRECRDWSGTETLQEVTHPGWAEACWQCEAQGPSLLLLVCWLYEQKFGFYWCSFRISKSYLFPFSSVPLTEKKILRLQSLWMTTKYYLALNLWFSCSSWLNLPDEIMNEIKLIKFSNNVI